LLPTLEDRFERLVVPTQWPNDHMDMVRHDDIRIKLVTIAIEMMQRGYEVVA
jgi:hypothetical protein